MIALPLGKLGELRTALGDDFEVDTDTLREAILRARCANAFYLPVVTKIDFFGRGYAARAARYPTSSGVTSYLS